MSPFLIILATLIIFFGPGVLILAAIEGERRCNLTFAEQIYLILSGSIIVSGWGSLFLAEVGLFSPVNVVILLATILSIVLFTVRNRLSIRLGKFNWKETSLAISVLIFTLFTYYPPFDYILGGRDPGVYVNTGFHLANNGSLTSTDSVIASIPKEDLALFFRVDKEVPDWNHLRFQGYPLENPETGRVVPQGLHLYPTWIGLVASLYEMKAGLYATPFFAMMAVLGGIFALKRIFGFEVAVWATAFWTVFQIQIWFARFPNAEILVQFLYINALLFIYFMEEKHSTVAGILGGIALGSTLLTRLENLLFVIPIAIFFGWKRLQRRFQPPEIAFLFCFLALSFHATLHSRYISWPYVSKVLNRHYWQMLWSNLWLITLLGILIIILINRFRQPAISLVKACLESEKARLTSAFGLFALATFAYFIRPHWHAPRTAPHDAEAFFRMSWYLYDIGIALSISGAMTLILKARKTQVFFLLTGLTFSLFFFYKARVWHDHYFAMRRYIPIILPTLLSCIALVLTVFHSHKQRIIRLGSLVTASALLLIYLSDGRKLWAFRGHEEFPGSQNFIKELARHIGNEDIVIFPRREGLHMLELPLAELHQKNVLEFYSMKPPIDKLEDLLNQWQNDYRDVYFITNYKISLSGLFTQHVKDFWFATEKFKYGYVSPPTGAEPFHLRFTLSKAVDLEELSERVPNLPHLDVGGSDDLQLAWFHEKELDDDGTSYRWSQKTSSVFLPKVGKSTKTIELRLAGPKEIGAPQYQVTVEISGSMLAAITPEKEFTTYTFTIPENLTSQTKSSFAILTLKTKTWRPANWIPNSTDVRDLGIRVDSVSVR